MQASFLREPGVDTLAALPGSCICWGADAMRSCKRHPTDGRGYHAFRCFAMSGWASCASENRSRERWGEHRTQRGWEWPEPQVSHRAIKTTASPRVEGRGRALDGIRREERRSSLYRRRIDRFQQGAYLWRGCKAHVNGIRKSARSPHEDVFIICNKLK